MSRSTKVIAAALVLSACAAGTEETETLSSLQKIATVDERFQSYNVEMVEVTGGRFWAPYDGSSDNTYRMRPPENLADERLRALARHLSPAYIRVSGTWANSTYLEVEGEDLSVPPTGYNQILTRDQWRGLVDFANAVGAGIGVSYAVSEGSRDADGVWQTDQAQQLLDLTREAGGELSFSEFINEPNAASLGHLPDNYSVEDYTRDFDIFAGWANHAASDMIIVGPGGVGEGQLADVPVANRERLLLTEELLKDNPNSVDVFSYHFYGAISQRCKNYEGPKVADKSEALAPEWLDLTLREWSYYTNLRDQYEAGDSVWITETAQAACGGSPWAASFLDSFRYVNQLGLLAQRGVAVIFHNTLAASDYALIDEEAKTPRPNYWAAILWRWTMGTTVLASPASPSSTLRIYAHCLPSVPGGVGLAAINLGKDPQEVSTGLDAQAWVMQAMPLDNETVRINGNTPQMDDNGDLTGLDGVDVSGSATIPGMAIAFLAVPTADNTACHPSSS